MIEFDVLAEHPDGSGELLLAHDWRGRRRAPRRTRSTRASRTSPSAAYDGIELDRRPEADGYEERVAARAARARAGERALVSTMENSSLALLRERHPEIRLGWSLPRMRRDPLRQPGHRCCPRWRVLTLRAPRAAGRRRQPHPPRRDRRAHGALAARHAAAGRRDQRRRRRALRLDGRRRRADRRARAHAASPASSPTTRGCSAGDRGV